MKVLLCTVAAVLVLLAVIFGTWIASRDGVDGGAGSGPGGGGAGSPGSGDGSAAPANPSKTLRERVRERDGETDDENPPHPEGWAVVTHMLDSYEDPESLVFTAAELIEEDPYPRWEVRAVATEEGFERITSLVRSQGASELLDSLQEETGGEAFSPENRPEIQFVSFRLDRRRPGDPGSDAPDETEFRRIPIFTFRVISRSESDRPIP